MANRETPDCVLCFAESYFSLLLLYIYSRTCKKKVNVIFSLFSNFIKKLNVCWRNSSICNWEKTKNKSIKIIKKKFFVVFVLFLNGFSMTKCTYLHSNVAHYSVYDLCPKRLIWDLKWVILCENYCQYLSDTHCIKPYVSHNWGNAYHDF